MKLFLLLGAAHAVRYLRCLRNGKYDVRATQNTCVSGALFMAREGCGALLDGFCPTYGAALCRAQGRSHTCTVPADGMGTEDYVFKIIRKL